MVPKQKKAPDTAIRGRPIRGRLKALTRLAGVAAGPRDPVFTLYRTLLAYGAVAILILLAGAAEFIYFEPFGKPAGVTVHIAGVYRYDPATHKTLGPDQRTFTRSDSFAAVVDWSGLPDSITVQAIWYDAFQNVVGGVGPGRPSELSADTVIPAKVAEGLKYHLPGQYIFAVERLDGNLPVEVLGRRIVLVER